MSEKNVNEVKRQTESNQGNLGLRMQIREDLEESVDPQLEIINHHTTRLSTLVIAVVLLVGAGIAAGINEILLAIPFWLASFLLVTLHEAGTSNGFWNELWNNLGSFVNAGSIYPHDLIEEEYEKLMESEADKNGN